MAVAAILSTLTACVLVIIQLVKDTNDTDGCYSCYAAPNQTTPVQFEPYFPPITFVGFCTGKNNIKQHRGPIPYKPVQELVPSNVPTT